MKIDVEHDDGEDTTWLFAWTNELEESAEARRCLKALAREAILEAAARFPRKEAA